ncbi:MAG: tetratricopeptide repeat protein [Ignavibacteria bacterium]
MASKEDTNKANILTKLADHYFNVNFDSALFYSEKAYEISNKINSIKGLAVSGYQKGLANFYLGKYETAIECFSQSIILYKNLDSINPGNNFKNKIACAYNETGCAKFALGKYNQSLECYNKALELYQKTKNDKGIADVYNYLSNYYFILSNHDKSLEYILKEYEIAKILNDKEYTARVNKSFGRHYIETGNTQKGLNYLKESLTAYKELENKKQIGSVYFDIGNTFLRMNKVDSAFHYNSKASAIAQKLNCKEQIGYSYAFSGWLSPDKNKAVEYFKKALEIFEEQNNKSRIACMSNFLGTAYKGLGDFNKAEFYFKKAFTISDELKRKIKTKDASWNLYRLYKKQKNYANALKYYEIYKVMSDSLLNEHNVKAITKRQMQHEFDLKQREQELLQQQKEMEYRAEIDKKRILLTSMFIIIGLLIITRLVIFWLIREKQKRKLQEIQNTLNIYMQQALRLQMNPHFIFNTLHSIQSYILENDIDSSIKYISKFADLMRIILQNSREQFISLEKELDALKLYIELEVLRFKNNINFEIDVDPAINLLDLKIPALLLQPYVENAIRHGLSHKENNRNLLIRISRKNSHILCSIEDNGIGRKRAEQLNHLNKFNDFFGNADNIQ